MYFDTEYYFKMLRRLWRERHWKPAKRIRLLLKLLFGVPLLYLVHATFFLLDYLVFPRLWTQRIESPVFIVGHARSGTTLMHRLMAADGERFSFFLYWEMFFPSLLQKKLIRGFGILDRKLFGRFFRRRLEAWDEKVFGPGRKMHHIGLWVPEEDNFVMTFAFASGYWTLQAPYMDELDIFYADRLPEKKRRRWLNYYRECVRRQLYLNGGDKIHLSKNPIFCGWTASLAETFPGARFVVLIRHPFECIPSLLKLMERNWRGRGWPEESYRESLEVLAQMSFDAYRMPRQFLERCPHVPHAVVDYRELVAEPKATVEAVYQQIGLDVSPALEKILDEQQSRSRQHVAKHEYTMAEYDLKEDTIRRELTGFFDEFNWDVETSHG
ncbi:MAG: sulfotransferase [Gammaproteobacteria bacterium]|nr:sulfotransferase [Gammaproteobacteria bacterium]MDH3371901.1 sulfotransferase [Gammaproteobacteria bacterium]MDH3407770.1 sulfotransferase [Gammaproteobacteria bacterium]MDH3551111.1 sulfotransferase [Gammaproteobacteria bacterium]